MRVCDRHNASPAVAEVVLSDTDSRYDLCQECIDKVAKFLGASSQNDIDPEKEPEKKPKRGILGFKNSA